MILCYSSILGLAVWPASLLLAQYLSVHPEICRDKSVIELGAGCGVPAIAAGELMIVLCIYAL